uniref:Uncharacterized protein n=1 Tax=Alexandrium catenella TaxID=2925 RepID=A0A7S1L877_ALECA|mmetsp:Transcript_108352/g.288336  ORF Transcript_108352/g.288336 Transcript_108352/m.288336 type:complete len:350 (+) Transcript_108352:100-1149(+)
MTQLVAKVGCAVAAAVSLAWLAVLGSSVHWVTSSSVIVNFQVTLFSVYASKGTASSMLSFVGHLLRGRSLIDKLMERSIWMEDALTEFCGSGVDKVFQWCGMWTMVAYASWFMLFSILLTVTLLLMGACFMYYYSAIHATATGRTCCRVCYGLAPCFCLMGLIVYTLCTLDFGKDALLKGQFRAHAMYSTGYVFAWFLAIVSWLPLYSMLVFMRRDPLEKQHWEDTEDCLISQQEAHATSYGTSAPGANTYAGPSGVPSNPYGPPAPGAEGYSGAYASQAGPYGAPAPGADGYAGTYGAPAGSYSAPAYGAPAAGHESYGYGGQAAQYSSAAPGAPPPSQPGYGGSGAW